ncbi:S1 RNA-binding domain-containing protein [Microcoleus sp. FACHB-831]|uniref:S1 RNA-binding domain-containing protein n=1 Tax=Microcoleus sp. FACHB-831 TaxID=2692827 RepID=UPI001686FF8F|nr:S1 RNA-binding domain-containing protein [Microcoleus sp. FACHB-831]MBD1919904.1 S1 RNA-binding domain-containing protein [Microcoleus sp. FACHB-831]
MNSKTYSFNPGDIVVGTVFRLEPTGALIDIGVETAAYIPLREMSIAEIDSPEDVLQLNETREFLIVVEYDREGNPILCLSIRRLEQKLAWERVRQLQAEDITLYAKVWRIERGGLIVRVEGLSGFVPYYRISISEAKEELLGVELPLKFVMVYEDRNRLVLSHSQALGDRDPLYQLKVGQVVCGTVAGIKPYGAFIDIGGILALLQVDQISHAHFDTPHSIFKVNDEVKAAIVWIDVERRRIFLSTKALEPEPGDMLRNPQIVYQKAEEMAAKYLEQLNNHQNQGTEVVSN